MCSHYLVEPTACTPAAGWEKGQVENQVGLVRERFFTPRLRFASYEELNAWLLDRCIEHAGAHRHPELRERSVADVFDDEKASLMRLPTTVFNGFHALTATVSKTLLVRFDYNKYSVAARALGRPAEVHAYADRIVIRQCHPMRRAAWGPRCATISLPSMRGAMVAIRRSTTRGITCRCWRRSRAR